MARARFVGEQETQGLTRQHGLINGSDLMGQRFHQRGRHGKQGTEQVGQANAMRFSRQAEQGAVAVETPGPALFHHIETRLVMAIQNLVRHTAIGTTIDQRQSIRTVPFHIDNRHQHIG